MEAFLPLFLKVFPLYILIAMGFVARRFLQVDMRSLARISIFLIAPVVIFHSGFTAPLEFSVLILPILFFLVSSATALLCRLVSPALFKDTRLGLFPFAAGNSNTGYFGLPVVLALLGQEAFTLAILVSLGSILYESTVGLLILTRGAYTWKESLKKILRIPYFYAFFAGLFLNFWGFSIQSPIYTDFIGLFKGAYVILGMMIVGAGISQLSRKSFDFRLIGAVFLGRFVLLPFLMFILLTVAPHLGLALSVQAESILWILSLVPVAANTVAYAVEFKIHPEETANVVFLSTLFALFFIPLMAPLL